MPECTPHPLHIVTHVLLRRKAMINLDSVLKSREITLLTKIHIVKAMVFPVVMYGCESWTIKKPEHPRIDAFELWCWIKLLRDPWTARSNQSILKEISPEYSLEGPMLKLKLQYCSHLIRRADLLTKTLMLWKIEGRRRRGWQRRRWLDSIADSMDMSLSKPQQMVKDREAWHAAVHRVAKIQTRVRDWATTHFNLQQIWWIKIFLFQNGGIWVLAEFQWEHSFYLTAKSTPVIRAWRIYFSF